MNKNNEKKNSRKNTRIQTKKQEFIPEIIHNKFSNEATIIVNEMIEKIISLTISTELRNSIENKISSSCFDFLKDNIDSYISQNFISYDKEEINNSSLNDNIKNELIQNIEPILNEETEQNNNFKDNLNNETNLFKFDDQLYFNNYYHGVNDWDLIEEPESNKYDRYATTLVKFKEIEKEKNYKFNKNNDKEIIEEINEESEKNSLNDINNKNTNNNNNLKEELKNSNDINLAKKRTSKMLNTNLYNNLNNTNRNKKKNLNEIMSQFSFHDLEDNNDIYKEQENINYEKLRKEAQEKQNVVNEEKKIQKNAKKEVENKIKLAVEKNRQYAGKKITVDSNGEIVYIKGIKMDKLSKEFLTLRTNTKIVREMDKEADKDKSKSKKKKKINNNNNLNNNTTNVVEDKDKEKNIEKENDIEEDNNNININEKNDNDKKNLKGRNQKLPKLKGARFRTKETSEDLYKQKLLKKIEEGPIVLSGSNFELMNMEVGVSIKEKEKYKTGGKDFYHKYNKYSIDNYNKQLKETLQVNSFLKTQTDENFGKSEINNYITNLTEGYNSSINFNNSNLNNQQTSNSNKNFLTNYNTLSNFGNSSQIKSKLMSTSLSPELKLSTQGISLKGSMDKLNLITERQERLAKKSTNLFKAKLMNLTSNKFTLPKLEEINKFSSEILTSSNWMSKKGVNNSIGVPFRKPGKPDFLEIKREIRYNGKITRSRMKNGNILDLTKDKEMIDFFKK